MNNPVLTPEEAIDHIKRTSAFRANLRYLALKILRWTIEWNETQPVENRILCFLRETENVGFFIDRDGNREKKKRPNFLVVKATKNYLDFGLGANPEKEYSTVFKHVKGHETRWLLGDRQFSKVDSDLLKGAFLDALTRLLNMPSTMQR